MLSFLPTLLLSLLPLTHGLSVSAPANWVSPGNNTLLWTTAPGDPPAFNAFVVAENASVLNGAFAVSSSVETAEAGGRKEFVLAPVPLDVPYQIVLTSTSNASDILASSSFFHIAANASSVASASTSQLGATSTATSLLSGASSRASSASTAASASSTTSAAAPTTVEYSNAVVRAVLVAVFGLA